MTLIKELIKIPERVQKGDFVLTRAYAGTRLKIHGQEFRVINDDSVEAVVQDPRGISRA